MEPNASPYYRRYFRLQQQAHDAEALVARNTGAIGTPHTFLRCVYCALNPDGSVKDLAGRAWGRCHQHMSSPTVVADHVDGAEHERRYTDGRMNLTNPAEREGQPGQAIIMPGLQVHTFLCPHCALDPSGDPRPQANEMAAPGVVGHMTSPRHIRCAADGRWALWVQKGSPPH